MRVERGRRERQMDEMGGRKMYGYYWVEKEGKGQRERGEVRRWRDGRQSERGREKERRQEAVERKRVGKTLIEQ